MSGDIVKIRARIGDDPESFVKTFEGRQAWMLAELVAAGADGITSLKNPAPRISDYVLKLRRAGVGIATEYEPHGGSFKGSHGKYRLTVRVDVLEIERAGVAP